MRAVIVCFLFTLIVQKEGSAERNDDFNPTPIPLNSWSAEKLDPAGTLQELIKTDTPTTVAALPAHYWEDALRHSVYLTLVRDKIDQLIAKGSVIAPDSKPDNSVSKEVDDHDLWEKIKTAPFDRVKEDPIPPGDVIILARGRLLEEKNGYRFAEGDEKCDKNNCTQPVKAYWSVKRTRQSETPSGKYHYELTFSVTSQAPRKIKKPYENLTRTFTIRENTATEHRPTQSSRNYGRHSDRTQRAIWFHKNIASRQNYQNRPESSHGLERIFSSLFSDDDNYDEITYRKPNAYMPSPYPKQNSKTGFVRDRESYQHKKIIPYNIKSQTFSYSRPPLPPPPVAYMQYPHVDLEQIGPKPHFSFHLDNRYIPTNPIKTTKQAFLPTPVTSYQELKESTMDVSIKTTLDATKPITNEPEIITTGTHKLYSNKQPPTKLSYFPDNIRPPIYNAPPGVFATMDKKPFKPMPPLKLKHSSKPPKNTPLDFRPSPQILDTTFTDDDATADNVFRPIALNLTEFLSSKKGPKGNRKHTQGKKPSKKPEYIKPHRLTTVSPDIITVSAESLDDDMQWAEILGAFTRTTPMASQREKQTSLGNDIITTRKTPKTTTETSEESTTIGTTSTTSTTTSTTTTTLKPKRTRPPPKFTKPDRIKKHKRVTSTTTSTTTTSKPMRNYLTKKPKNDLIPQASSASTSGANNVWESIDKRVTTTMTATPTTSTVSTTSTNITQSTTQITSTFSFTPSTEDSAAVVLTTQPKSKNRYRQSTLMHKGTSVNHDKWSTSTFEKNRTIPTVANKNSIRRKASKFQGYIPSSTPRQPEIEKNRDDHRDHGFTYKSDINSSQITMANNVKTTPTTQPNVERIPQENKSNNFNFLESDDNPLSDNESENEGIEIDVEDAKEQTVHDTKDDSEYIFPIVSHTPEGNSGSPEKQSTTEHSIIALPHTVTKNNTKCKKKKHENSTATENLQKNNEIVSTVNSTNAETTTISTATTPDIFRELFGGFTMDDFVEKQKASAFTAAPQPSESESMKHEKYIPIDDDIEDFLHSLNQNSNETNNEDDSDEEYEDNDDEDSPFNNEEDKLDSRQINGDYYDESIESQSQQSQHQPYSIFELMAME